MKNQYFGDINDYRKYGLLRVLVSSAGLSTIVAWMLTSDDGKTDGRKIAYLNQSERWQAFDRELFDFLRSTVIDRSLRSISEIESSGLLLGCRFHSKSIDGTIERREAYFQKLWKMAGSPSLVFFDPDNGFEVPSVRRGYRMASKYLYWSEFREGFSQGHSLLIFQHFRQGQRADVMVSSLARKCASMAKVPLVIVLWASPVAYFLVPQRSHSMRLESASRQVAEVWKDQITWWKIEAT